LAGKKLPELARGMARTVESFMSLDMKQMQWSFVRLIPAALQ